MKVVHVVSSEMAIKYVLYNQLCHIRDRGYKIFAICSSCDHQKEYEDGVIKIKKIRITRKISPFADLRALVLLFLFFKKERIDIVHPHTLKPTLLGNLAARLAGVPIVVNTLRLYSHDGMGRLVKRLYFLLERLNAFLADIILAQNREAIEIFKSLNICPSHKLRFLGNGIDLQRFNKDFLNQSALASKRIELGIGPDHKIIGIVGRFTKAKGFIEFFRAANIIKKKYPPVKFLAITVLDNEKTDALERDVVRSFGLGKDLIFLENRTDMPELYALMGVFVLPSHRESFPRAAMEAASMGIPIVATDISGCRQIVENGVNGILVKVMDHYALADAILDLLNNPAKAADMGQRGIEKARREFDEKMVSEKVLEAYRDMAEIKGLRRPASL